MTARLSSPYVRVAIAGFVGVALAALGCSLIVDFDESKIPADDTGVSEGDSIADTGAPPNDSIAKPDSDAGKDGHVDGDAPPAETTADVPDGTDTTPPPDTGTGTDTTVDDTGTGTDTTVDDTGTGTDTTVDDTTVDDTTVTDTTVDDTTDAATE